jgi:L-amino acid N-acyltransferase
MTIRLAGLSDIPAICAIYNDVVATSTAVYTSAPGTVEDRAAWFETRASAGYPVMVADAGSGALAFASYGEWRGAWPGYLYTVEHSVHVGAAHRGKGLGRALMRELIGHAAASGKHIMVGGIDAANAGSLRFHRSLGFAEAARFNEVGRKFGRWLDLVFMQRFLDAPGAPRP